MIGYEHLRGGGEEARLARGDAEDVADSGRGEAEKCGACERRGEGGTERAEGGAWRQAEERRMGGEILLQIPTQT